MPWTRREHRVLAISDLTDDDFEGRAGYCTFGPVVLNKYHISRINVAS